MSDVTVQINGTLFKMSFSLKVFRTLGRIWGLETLPEVMEKIGLIDQLEDSGRLDVYDILFDILFQSIDCHPGNETKISKDEIESLEMDQLMNLANQMASGITEAFGKPDLGVNEKKKKALKK